jgi:protein involved in sex pheromone biosynthesis
MCSSRLAHEFLKEALEQQRSSKLSSKNAISEFRHILKSLKTASSDSDKNRHFSTFREPLWVLSQHPKKNP